MCTALGHSCVCDNALVALFRPFAAAVQLIDSMASGSAKVLDQVLKLIDAYDLYGSVAYPKRHTQDDISDIYLLPAATRGVFVNIALQVSKGMWTGVGGLSWCRVRVQLAVRSWSAFICAVSPEMDSTSCVQQQLHGPAHVVWRTQL